jgi:micrococcal nuclease
MRTAVTLTLLLLVSASAIPAQTDVIPTLPTEALIDSGPPEPIRETSGCTIQRIIDGDTIECAEVGRVRLIGMDTPELSQEPYGTLATEALAALAPVGSRVELERDVELRDQYGRTLAYVWADGLQVNWALVRQGWAVLLTYPPNVQYVDWYTEAQRRAREDGVGLWSLGGFDCPPVDRRRGRCD